MSAAVWKFPLVPGPNVLQMPKGARVLHVHDQNGVPCLWALVDPDAKVDMRGFLVAGTGQLLSDDIERATYHGAAHCRSYVTTLVWHVFELPASTDPSNPYGGTQT